MKKGWGMKIQVLVVFLTAVVAAAGIWYLGKIQTSLEDQSVASALEVTTQGAHSLEVYLEKDSEMVETIAAHLSRLDSQDQGSIFDAMNMLSGLDGVYSVADLKHGLVFSGQMGSNLLKSDEQSVAEYAGLGSSGVKEPYLNELTGEQMLGYYKRFRFSDGAAGLVQKGESASKVADEFSLSFYDNSGFSFVVNAKGDILLRPQQKNSEYAFTNIFDALGSGEQNTKEMIERFEAELDAGKQGVMRFVVEKTELVFAYVPIENTDGWYLISMIPGEVILEHGNQILRSAQTFAAIIAVAVLILFLFMVVIRQNRRRVREKEQEIEYREQLFDILTNNTGDVFLMLRTSDYTVEYVSPNVERVLGVPEGTVKGNLESLGRANYTGEQRTEYENLKHLEPGGVVVLEGERVHKKTGEHHYFTETIYHAVIDRTDKYIVTLSDRTAERQSTQALEEALNIAKIANESKSTFLSNMSHDIRTPMNAIVGLCTLLQRDAGNEKLVREHVRKITASSHHLLGLINDVLDMTKIESGKTTLNISEINLAEFVREMESIMRSQARAKSQEFEVSVHDIREEHLLGDKLRIGQVMINILSNAIKYTPKGGKITMALQQIPSDKKHYAHLRFAISDNGMGMSKEYQERLFEPFTRETNSTTNTIQGTGLGMAITKSLIDLMGGTITVESAPGEGSTFTVDLNLRVQEQEIDRGFWLEHGVTHILVADDDEMVCDDILGAMTDSGVWVEATADGETAVARVKEAQESGEAFDLILVDWQMPKMDGVEVTRRLRDILPVEIPIIIVSAFDWSEIEAQALAAGVSGFIPKPFFLTNFRRVVDEIRICGRSVMAQEDEASPAIGMHFLAVEDNELNAEILSEFLDMLGATCELAVNGKEGMEKFVSSSLGQFDMILMDVQMPVMNGYEATRAIRKSAHPEAQTIPIVAMTANAFSEDIKEALDSGMNAHIAKPVDMNRLESVIREMMHERL